jgi:hypothetical protein
MLHIEEYVSAFNNIWNNLIANKDYINTKKYYHQQYILTRNIFNLEKDNIFNDNVCNFFVEELKKYNNIFFTNIYLQIYDISKNIKALHCILNFENLSLLTRKWLPVCMFYKIIQFSIYDLFDIYCYRYNKTKIDNLPEDVLIDIYKICFRDDHLLNIFERRLSKTTNRNIIKYLCFTNTCQKN